MLLSLDRSALILVYVTPCHADFVRFMKRTMADAPEIIVLDDDDEDEPPQPSKAKKGPCKPVPQSNGKKDDGGKISKKALIVSMQNKQLFEEFVEYCSKVMLDHPEVITFLRGRYDKASPAYITSVEFRNTVGRCLTRVQNKRTKVFVYINELCTALKANSQKRKVSLLAPAPKQPVAAKSESVEDKEDNEKEEPPEETPERKKGSKRQIRYLENLLRIYSQEIRKLQEKELSLDELEDEDSSYIQESRLKRKLVRIFEKLCEIKDCPSLTGRVIEQKIQYRGTRYPEVNRRLEKFINSTRDLFPDYVDVLRVVQKTNDKYNLGLTRKQMQEMSKDAFCELGKKLKERRHLDMVFNFGSHLTDTFKPIHDPALQDTSLARNLRENRNVAMSHLDDIIKKYAEMQEDGEEEERKKWRKESEMPSTSKISQSKPPESRDQGSDEEEEEDDEESQDSDTDIEEEIKQSEQVEDGEEEEDENPGDQENEADQNMSDPQAFSSGGEGNEDDDVNNGQDIMDGQEESVEAESSPASTSLSHDKESTNTSIESGIGPLLQCDTPTPDKMDDEHSRDQEDAVSHLINPEASLEDHTEVQKDSHCSPQATEQVEDEPLCEETARETESTEEQTDAQTGSSIVEKKQEEVPEEEDITVVTDDVPVEESDDERTVAAMEESSPSNTNEEPCIDNKTKADVAEQGSRESSADEAEPLCMDTSATDVDVVADATCTENESPPGSDAEDCHEISTEPDVDVHSSDTDCDVSLLGNGLLKAADRKNTGLHRLKRHEKETAQSDSLGNSDVDADKVPCRKRKNMSSPARTENGLTKYNGSDQVEAPAKRKCQREKSNCSSQTSPACSSGPDSDHDITLDLMVTCSPPETPPRPSDQGNKSHASTQCDPDEVIVLSD